MTCCPAFAACDGFLLPEELRSFVVPDHVRQRDGRIFVHNRSVGLEAHGRNARRVDDALDADLARQLQKLSRSIDVGGVHLLRIAHPQADSLPRHEPERRSQ